MFEKFAEGAQPVRQDSLLNIGVESTQAVNGTTYRAHDSAQLRQSAELPYANNGHEQDCFRGIGLSDTWKEIPEVIRFLSNDLRQLGNLPVLENGICERLPSEENEVVDRFQLPPKLICDDVPSPVDDILMVEAIGQTRSGGRAGRGGRKPGTGFRTRTNYSEIINSVLSRTLIDICDGEVLVSATEWISATNREQRGAPLSDETQSTCFPMW